MSFGSNYELLEMLRELDATIIVPDLKKRFKLSLFSINLLSKYFNDNNHPFYVCIGRNCIKIKNQKRWWKLSKDKITRNSIYELEVNNLIKILFNQDKINIEEILAEVLERNNKKEFDFDLFLENIHKDLLLKELINSSTIEKSKNNIICNINTDSLEKAEQIINYFNSYQKDLKRLNIKEKILLNLQVK